MFRNTPYRSNHAATGKDDHGQMWIIGGREDINVPSYGFPTIQIYYPSTNKLVTSNDRGGMLYVFEETGDNPGGYVTPNKVYNRADISDQIDKDAIYIASGLPNGYNASDVFDYFLINIVFKYTSNQPLVIN